MSKALELSVNITENLEELTEIIEDGQLSEMEMNEIRESFVGLYENNDTIKDFVDWLGN